MKQVKLNIHSRSSKGRTAARRLRSSGMIPAVMYGPSGVRSLAVKETDFRDLMRDMHGSVAIIEAHDDKGVTALSLLKQAQRDAVTDRFTHIDLLEVSADREIIVNLPVRIVGECFGVKTEGGTLEITLHEVAVRCLPKHMPELVEVDVTELRAGSGIHIKNLPQLPHVTFVGDLNQPVVLCTEKEEEPVEAAATPGAAAPAAPAGAAAAKPAK